MKISTDKKQKTLRIFICASKYNYCHIASVAKYLKSKGHKITMPNRYNDPFFEERMKKISREKHIQVKRKYLKMQVKKVAKNDVLLIINMTKGKNKNYIGGSTFLEMYKAFEFGKKIFLYNPIPEGAMHDEITAFNPVVINGNLDLIK